MSLKLALLGLLPPSAHMAYKFDATETIVPFCTGPGSYSPDLCCFHLGSELEQSAIRMGCKAGALDSVLRNSTVTQVRIVHSMILHLLIRPFRTRTPDKLFHPVILRVARLNWRARLSPV